MRNEHDKSKMHKATVVAPVVRLVTPTLKKHEEPDSKLRSIISQSAQQYRNEGNLHPGEGRFDCALEVFC